MKTILIVDDDDLFADMLSRSLVAMGYGAVRARDGRSALQLYSPKRFSLVLTDLVMPEMEGLELIMALRRQDPAVKIIAMSGGGRNAPQDYLGVARRLGANQLLVKPFTLEQLRTALVAGEAEP